MSPTDAKIRAAELRIPFPVAEGYYHEEREASAALLERRRALRSWIYSRYGGTVAFHARFIRGRSGDHANIPQWDVWASAAAGEWPELLQGDDPSAALWEFVNTPADRAPTSAETWERAFKRAVHERSARELEDSADLVSIDDAASLADITPQWARALVRAGKLAGRRVGKTWLVSRSAALAFRRHPTAGRPRRTYDRSEVPF